MVWDRRAVDIAVVHPPVLDSLRQNLHDAGYRLVAITPTAQIWSCPRATSEHPPVGTTSADR
jgi:hypothetical protein